MSGEILSSCSSSRAVGLCRMCKIIGTYTQKKKYHRAQEHLFVIKSVIGMYEHMGKAIILQLWDISNFFDRESLADGHNELYKNEVRGKLYKLLYEMNKDTRIKVRTPVGDTEERDTGEG